MIKKILTAILIANAIASASSAQDYQKFRVGIGLGFTAPIGLLYTIEPSYYLNNDMVIGIRFEGAVTGLTENIWSNYKSYTINAQHYFGDNNNFRPFIGAGLGYYKVTKNSDHDSKFGFCPRVGFDFDLFGNEARTFIALDYNLIQSTQTTDYTSTNSYLSIRIGFFLGGRKKEK